MISSGEAITYGCIIRAGVKTASALSKKMREVPDKNNL